MSEYKPRYLIEVDSVRGGMDSPREARAAYDDREWAVQEVNHIDLFRNVYITDRANQTSRKTETLYYGAGYYDLPFKGKSLDALDHYMKGKIDRMADIALDNIDTHAAKLEREFNERWHGSSVRAKSVS